MVRRKKSGLLAWVMALIISLGSFTPVKGVLAATPDSLDAHVEVTGVAEDGIIDGSTEIKIRVSFPVPVIGDGVSDYFEHGDEVVLLLSKSFKFDSDPPVIEMSYDGKPLGTVTLSNNDDEQAIATVKFDGDKDIFDPDELSGGTPYSDVSGWFEVNLKYNGEHAEDDEGNKIVNILEKTYRLLLPGDTLTYTVEKTAVGDAVDLDAGTIKWTVTITATKDTEPEEHIDLKEYVFVDDLADVGEYVTDSFSLSGGTLVVPDVGETPPVTALSYTFPAGSISPQTITFKTKISEDLLTNEGKINNGASLELRNKEVGFDDFTVTISKPQVSKSWETNDVTTGATYNPTDRKITWYIKVDNDGRTLNDLTITDELKNGLIFESAKWRKQISEGNWEDVDGISWSDEPTDSKYVIGNVNYIGQLVIVTKVPDGLEGVSVVKGTYYNQATVTWSGSGETTGSATTGNPGVGIGYNALSKTGTQVGDDVKNHQITWTINVNMKGQNATDFKVYDLFVHDAKTLTSDITGATSWPSSLSIGSNNITRNNGQEFVKVVYEGTNKTDSHLSEDQETIKIIKLENADGDHMATLVEVTGLQDNGSNKVVLKSQVVDPDILAGNDQSKQVYNYTSLYRDTVFRGSANDSVSYNNKVLSKEMLKRAEVGNAHNPEAAINANNRTIDVADGFHYGFKEVIFRLNINAAGLDFKDAETTLTGGFGDVIVTDTLPKGWEFSKFFNEEYYLIYETTGTLDTGSEYPTTGSLKTLDGPLDSVDGLTAQFTTNDDTDDPQTATFTFKNLAQSYVILVKAGPTDDTFDGYLLGADTHEETNSLTLETANWTPGKTVSQNTEIDSTVLEKTHDLSKIGQGILIWEVEYTPFNHDIGTGIEDTLPEGIDLRTDSSGELIWETDGIRNINVYPMTLNEDGTDGYTVGTELELEDLKAVIGYDSDYRLLTFAFPEKTQAYKLTYVTDITGMPGAVSNKVKLVDAEGTGTSKDKSFTITEQQGGATMGRSGWLVVKKTDKGGTALSSAEFTLYNTNPDGSKGSSRAVRVTGSDGTAKFYGLSAGKYILVETQYPGVDYTESDIEYEVFVGEDLKTTINGSEVNNVTPFNVVNYKASDDVGGLTISKKVAGDGADTSKTFDFIITLEGDGVLGNSYTYVGHNVSGGTIKSGDTISLAHGQSITIIGLPAGTTYTVTETDYTTHGYTVSIEGDGEVDEKDPYTIEGTTVADEVQSVTFTNTRTVGDLVISKRVAGNAANRTKEFEFHLVLDGFFSEGNEGYEYIITDANNEIFDSGHFPGEGDVILIHGQQIMIKDLPAGATYTVTEEDYSSDGYRTRSTGEIGEIVADETQVASFTNTRNIWEPGKGSLTVSKTVVGSVPGGEANEEKFEFTIELSGPIGASYLYAGSGVPDGTIVSGGAVFLGDGDSITISGLEEGTKYTVTEADYTESGYVTVSTGETGTIADSASSVAAFTNTYEEPEIGPEDPTDPEDPKDPEDPGEDILDPDIPREPGEGEEAENGLPKTGDNQNSSMAKFGLAVFSAALVILYVLYRVTSNKGYIEKV